MCLYQVQAAPVLEEVIWAMSLSSLHEWHTGQEVPAVAPWHCNQEGDFQDSYYRALMHARCKKKKAFHLQEMYFFLVTEGCIFKQLQKQQILYVAGTRRHQLYLCFLREPLYAQTGISADLNQESCLPFRLTMYDLDTTLFMKLKTKFSSCS